jgi:hypothetical protein
MTRAVRASARLIDGTRDPLPFDRRPVATMRFAEVATLLAVVFQVAAGQQQGEDDALLRARCGRGQLVHRVSVFEDGVVEAECGPQPCGVSGARCRENQPACRDRSDVLAGMHWSSNGQR